MWPSSSRNKVWMIHRPPTNIHKNGMIIQIPAHSSSYSAFQQFLILVKLLQELKVYFHLSGMIWIKLLLILAPPPTSLKQWQYRVDQRINPNNPRLLNIFQYICSYSCGEYSWEKCMNETSFPVHPRSLLWMWYSDRRYSRFWQRGCPFRSRWMDVN